MLSSGTPPESVPAVPATRQRRTMPAVGVRGRACTGPTTGRTGPPHLAHPSTECDPGRLRTHAQLLQLGNQISVVGAALIVASQLLAAFLPSDAAALATTATSAPFLVSALLKLVGFLFLMLGLVTLYAHQAVAAGRLGLVGFATAFAGTLLVTGDWWFEAFAVPWLAQTAPGLFAMPAGSTRLLGGAISFTTFSAGWVVFGAATLRARVFPRWVATLLMAGAVLAYGQGHPPLGAPLAIAVGIMGIVALRLDQSRCASPPAINPPESR